MVLHKNQRWGRYHFKAFAVSYTHLDVYKRQPFTCEAIASLQLDAMRLDYGCNADIMEALHKQTGISTFILNASILQEKELLPYLEKAKEHQIQIKACHNFYPREDTGLDMDFMISQYQLFHKYGIPVTACIASHTHPRGPIFKGLPTMEKQRYMSVEKAALELSASLVADWLLAGDAYLKETELDALYLSLIHIYKFIIKNKTIHSVSTM